MNRAGALLIALTLAACGSRGELRPPPGQSLPVAPFGRADRPSAAELLTRSPQAAPERNVELRRRSEERQDDPFDLPPEEMGTVRRLDSSAPPRTPSRDCPPTAGRGGGAQLAVCEGAGPRAGSAADGTG